MKKYSWGEGKRGNLQKSGIRYEIAAVALLARNDLLLLSLRVKRRNHRSLRAKRGNLPNNAICREIAAVALFLRNDLLLPVIARPKYC